MKSVHAARCAFAVCALASVLASSCAAQQPKDGKWSGSTNDVTVSFTVLPGGKKVAEISARVWVTTGFGAGRLSGQPFKGEYDVVKGEFTASDTRAVLKGKFLGPNKAKGTLSIQATSVTYVAPGVPQVSQVTDGGDWIASLEEPKKAEEPKDTAK